MNLPKDADINLFDTPDEKQALLHFLGKSLDEATQMFVENSLLFQEDLLWMGPKAFDFYLLSVYRYLKHPQSKDDIDFISALIATFEFRKDKQSIGFANPKVIVIFNHIIKNDEYFNIDEHTLRTFEAQFDQFEKCTFEECVTLSQSNLADDLIIAAQALGHLKQSETIELEKIYTLLLEMDRKCPGVADIYLDETLGCGIVGDVKTIDWMFKVLEQRKPGRSLSVLLDGNDLEFYLHEAIDNRPDDIIRAIHLRLIYVVSLALDHWYSPITFPAHLPWDRHQDIVDALKQSEEPKLRSIANAFSKLPTNRGNK